MRVELTWGACTVLYGTVPCRYWYRTGTVATDAGARRAQQVPEPSTSPTQPSTRGERPLPPHNHGGHSSCTRRHSGPSRRTTPPRPLPHPGGQFMPSQPWIRDGAHPYVMNNICILPPRAHHSYGHNGVIIALPPCSSHAGRGPSHRCMGPSKLVFDPRPWPPQSWSPLLSNQG